MLTYESIGIEGVELLKNSDIENSFQNDWVYNAFKTHSLLEAKQCSIAKSLGLPLNDPKVIAQLFSDKENIKLAHSVEIGLATEEQLTVQNIYKKEFVEIMLDPTLGWLGHQAKLDEIKILDKTFNFFDYVDNPADLEQRLKFAEILLGAIDDGISKGDFSKLQDDVLKMAAHSLWLANPHTTPNAIGDINGAFWGPKADEFDKQVKDSVVAFLNDNLEDLTPPQEIALKIADANIDPSFPASVLTGEHKIVEITVDPLDYFLDNNPNYEVIANNISELWNSTNYFRDPIYGGTIFSNPNIPYLGNKAYLVLYTDGEYQYYQPSGEVRGITFPFMYDKTTGIPLTMPILDPQGHYNHASTIDTIYNNPTAFNTPSNINWYNPYWNQAVQQAKAEALSNYFKAITVDSFMNAVVAPTNTINYNYSNAKLELKIGDIIHNDSNLIDFSTIHGNGNVLVVAVKLANGENYVLNEGSYVCNNCNSSDPLLEQAVNAMMHVF